MWIGTKDFNFSPYLDRNKNQIYTIKLAVAKLFRTDLALRTCRTAQCPLH